MPYEIKWEKEGVVFRWYGRCTYEENLEANGKLYGDKRFESIKYQISNILDADTSSFTDRNIEVVAKLELKAVIWNKNLMVAHVTKDPKLIEQIRLYENVMKDSNWNFGIFESMEDARKWIDQELHLSK